MKITASLLFISLAASVSLRAADTTEPAKGAGAEKPAASKGSPADTAWGELEALLKGPTERPKTREEAEPIYKKYLAELDAKGAAFLKAFPEDARRWQLRLQQVRMNSAREAFKLNPLGDKEIEAALGEILDAKDADAETKSVASYIRVMNARDDDENFKKLAEAHTKAFPDFPGNKGLESQLTKIESRKSLKEKPLDLKFTAVDGTEVDLSKLRGKVVLVDFWATWCGPCVGEIPKVVATYEKLHDSGFEIVGISFDQDKAKLEKMTKDKGMPWVQFFDGQGWKNKFGQQFGVNSIPEMWLVDKKGMVVDTNARQDLESKVQKLLAE